MEIIIVLGFAAVIYANDYRLSRIVKLLEEIKYNQEKGNEEED